MSKKEINKKYSLRKRELKMALRKSKAEHKLKYDSAITLLKAERTEQLLEYYEKENKEPPKDPPKRSLLEEIGNATSHGLGAVFALVACVLMMIAADNKLEYIAASIYSFGLFLAFAASCLYHAFNHGSTVKRLFRRFDYSSIYVLIAATFAPVLLVVFDNTFGYVFFVIQWLIVAFGITMVGVFGPTRLRFLHIPLYVLLGWSALMLMPGMLSASPPLFLYISRRSNLFFRHRSVCAP